jgi:hypothetical protein
MARSTWLARSLLAFVVVASVCAHPATSSATSRSADSGTMTAVGTPRSQTLVVQTFDNKTLDPGNMNTLTGSWALWRGLRELGLGFLWEMNTATGRSGPSTMMPC